jgi:hypothetical protein
MTKPRLHLDSYADYKAVSMNLMHADIKITDSIYAPILSNEVQHRISRLSCGFLHRNWCHDAYPLAQSFETVYNAKQYPIFA